MRLNTIKRCQNRLGTTGTPRTFHMGINPCHDHAWNVLTEAEPKDDQKEYSSLLFCIKGNSWLVTISLAMDSGLSMVWQLRTREHRIVSKKQKKISITVLLNSVLSTLYFRRRPEIAGLTNFRWAKRKEKKKKRKGEESYSKPPIKCAYVINRTILAPDQQLHCTCTFQTQRQNTWKLRDRNN